MTLYENLPAPKKPWYKRPIPLALAILGLAAVLILPPAGFMAAVTSMPTATKVAPVEAVEPIEPEPIEVQAPTEPAETDALFLSIVRDEYPLAVTLPDADLIGAALAVCGAFDAGATFEEVGMMILASEVPAKLGGAILGAGTAAYCPEHSDQIGG